MDFAMKMWIIAAALGIVLAAGGASGALSQAGSTGGTLGNTDKSISGDREESRRSERLNPRPSKEEHTISEPSIAGRWRWDARCGQGSFSGEFEIGDGKQFTGAFISDVAGPISNGHRNGNQISFLRSVLGHLQPWTATLRGPNTMFGTLVRADWGNDRCTWTATR
jgi:hypothetical protein